MVPKLETASIDVCPREKIPIDIDTFQGLLDKMLRKQRMLQQLPLLLPVKFRIKFAVTIQSRFRLLALQQSGAFALFFPGAPLR